jgi:hypothetical protein
MIARVNAADDDIRSIKKALDDIDELVIPDWEVQPAWEKRPRSVSG